MNKMCLAFLGALLLALHLISSQVVQAQNTTADPMNATMPNYTMTPGVTVNTPTKGNGCGRTDAFTLLLPLAAAASLLYGWS